MTAPGTLGTVSPWKWGAPELTGISARAGLIGPDHESLYLCFVRRPDHQSGLDGKDEALVLRISFGNHRIIEDVTLPDETDEVLFDAFHVH